MKRIINMQFQKVYVISLMQNKDRRLFIQEQMNELGIPFEFIYGIDYFNLKTDRIGDDINYPDMTNSNINFDCVDHLDNDKMYGCTMAHYQAVSQAYELGYKNVLILEDDICFTKDIDQLVFYLQCIPPDADFITYCPRFSEPQEFELYYEELQKYDLTSPNFTRISNEYTTLCGTMMYGLMNRQTMKLYLDSQREHLNRPDRIEKIFNNSEVIRYGTVNAICLDQYHILKYSKAKDVVNTCNNYDFCYEQVCVTKDYENFFKPRIYNISNINTKLENEVENNQRSYNKFKFEDEPDIYNQSN